MRKFQTISKLKAFAEGKHDKPCELDIYYKE